MIWVSKEREKRSKNGTLAARKGAKSAGVEPVGRQGALTALGPNLAWLDTTTAKIYHFRLVSKLAARKHARSAALTSRGCDFVNFRGKKRINPGF